MCGILGIVSRPGRFSAEDVHKSIDLLYHRGPDGTGLYKQGVTTNWEIWMAHRRLAILDTSYNGHQPMVRTDEESKKDLAIVFNGEIYNHKELRQSLSINWQFSSRSDTEVLLAGMSLKGVSFLKELNSMHAFAFYNDRKKSLVLSRDRLGKKPLYLLRLSDLLIFASELKSIRQLISTLRIDNNSLSYYRWLGYVPATRTIYENCQKFPAASYVEIDLKNDEMNELHPKLYWDPLASYGQRYLGTYRDAKAEFDSILESATKLRVEADVPVGLFLSGGIDSSLVATSLVDNYKNISAYTVEVSDPHLNEADVAADTAAELGLSLHTLKLGSEDFNRQLSKIPYHFDEPFSDSSQVPTLAISEAARRKVTVVLTGDGGDEVFLGYPRFSQQESLKMVHFILKFFPYLDKVAAAALNTRVGRSILVRLLSMTGVGSSQANIDSKIGKICSLLSCKNDEQIYEGVMCVQQKSWMTLPDILELGEQSLISKIRSWYPDYSWDSLNDRSYMENLAALDLITYLRDDVLVKVDRGTMAYSLEARSPLLDYRVVEFGHSLPLSYKYFRGIHKRILRDSLADKLRGNTASLGKKGFGVPLPENLPCGRNLTVRWNFFIEQQWRQQFSF